jgi:hypothetical protein
MFLAPPQAWTPYAVLASRDKPPEPFTTLIMRSATSPACQWPEAQEVQATAH